MKFTLSWLKEHLETGADLTALLEALTKVGLEVEGVEDPAEKLGAFRIARVLSAAAFPGSACSSTTEVSSSSAAAAARITPAPPASATCARPR